MVGHIYIYGEIANYQDVNSQDYGIVSLKSVVNSLELNKDADEIVVHIHSPGGDVYEGLAIHDVLKASGKKITTRVEGLCASIATVILLAGSEREATPNSQIFIHNAWTFAMGDANELKKVSDGLQKYNDIINSIYTNNTKLTQEEAEKYMNEETEFTTVQALDNGFITREATELKAVAKINTNNMGIVENAKEFLAKFKDQAPETKNVIVALEDGTMIDSSSEVESPAIGDAWTVEGKSIESGTYATKSGYNVKIEAGKVIEAEKSEEPEIDIKAMAKELVELKASFDTIKAEKETLETEKEAELTKIKAELTDTTNVLNETLTKLKASTSVKFDDSKPEDKEEEIQVKGNRIEAYRKKKEQENK